jgi:hypothetical protein
VPNFTTQSARWAIFNAIAVALAGDARLQGLRVVRNPRNATQMGAGEQLVAIKWGSDSLTEKPGQREKRKFRLIVASISRKAEGADKDADAIHEAAYAIVREILPAIAQLPEVDAIGGIAESDTTSDIDGLEVDGAVVLSSWEINYARRRA